MIDWINEKAAQFVEGAINNVLSKRGELVESDVEAWRKDICNGCEYLGKVSPIRAFPSIKMDGCTVCKCPIATKTRFKFHPVEIEELETLKAIGAFWAYGKTTLVETHCPKGKWNDKELANKYKDLKK